jgi:hypothetical protein
VDTRTWDDKSALAEAFMGVEILAGALQLELLATSVAGLVKLFQKTLSLPTTVSVQSWNQETRE